MNFDFIPAWANVIAQFVVHHFFGLTEQEARHYYKEHMGCEYLAAAVRDGRTVETLEEIDDDELPEAEEDDDEDEE